MWRANAAGNPVASSAPLAEDILDPARQLRGHPPSWVCPNASCRRRHRRRTGHRPCGCYLRWRPPRNGRPASPRRRPWRGSRLRRRARSGNRMRCGASSLPAPARPAAAASQPAWRPIARTRTPGRGLGHRRHVQRAFAHGDRGVLGRRAEARAAVGDREVVVDGLGHAHAGQRIAVFRRQLRDLSAVSAESLPPL